MVPGGITEIIWHFAGYFRLANEYAKDVAIYEEGPQKRPVEDYTTARPDDAAASDFDPFETLGSAVPNAEPLADHVAQHLPYLKSLKVSFPRPSEPDDPDSTSKAIAPRSSVVGGAPGAGQDFKITISYGDGSSQTEFEVAQRNHMLDDDYLFAGEGHAVLDLRPSGVDAALGEMAAEARAEVPEPLDVPQGTAEAIEFLKAHDQQVAAGGQNSEHAVEAGRYVNGDRDAAEPPQDPEPLPEVQPPPDFGTAPGQWAVTGGNIDINAALIVDLSESARTMVVLGDYFKTNAIVQTNSYADSDNIETAAGAASPGIIAGDNTADNIATFAHDPGLYADLPARFAGPHWHVDVVNGDFHDIHLIIQENFLSDNDVIVQDSRDIHYEVRAGENNQFNLTEIFSGEIKYDLIIIAGNYHGANIIFQHNILLDDDVVKQAGLDDPASPQSVTAGQNALLNNAGIYVYGDDNFQILKPGLDDLVSAVASGEGELDPSYGMLIAGNGGTLNVLYVTGDYYDINAIWQINVIADADVALQLLQDPTGYRTPGEDEESAGQSVMSGNNQLTNDAAIIDVGSTDAFVNGDVYTDTILIQTRLVDNDDDRVTVNDPNALVSELIAFTDPNSDDSDTLPQQPFSVPQDDPMASVLS